MHTDNILPRGSAKEAGLLTRRKQEVLGPGGPGVRGSWWEGEELPDLEEGDWDFSVCQQNQKTDIIMLNM